MTADESRRFQEAEQRVRELERFAVSATALSPQDLNDTMTPAQWARAQLAATVLARWFEALAAHRRN